MESDPESPSNYPEFALAEDKLSALESQSLQSLHLTTIKPDRRFDWFDQTELDWEDLVPVVDSTKRHRRSTKHITAIFEVASAGLQTKQDDWAYGRESADVRTKMRTLIATYEATRLGAPKPTGVGNIKWHRELDRRLKAGISLVFDDSKIVESAYRAFARRYLYFDAATNSQSFRLHELFIGQMNPTIVFSDPSFRTSFSTLASNLVPEHHFLASKDSFQAVPRYRYTKSGERLDNITDWAHHKFVTHYGNKCITKDAIFQYVYAILHDPIYRQTYALNLKREFPRIPFYADFTTWAAWGETLTAIHIGYEEVEPWPIKRIDTPSKRAEGTNPKPILGSYPDQRRVLVDGDTQVTGIPKEAWEYRLGNRSAIDWVLDQYKEKIPRDPTIRERFNSYRFADNKERMISLLAKVVRVSMDTVAITQAMKTLDRKSPLSSLS